MPDNLYQLAANRIQATPALRPYHDLLLWGFPAAGGSRSHWRWVATAPAHELEAWAIAREAADGWDTPQPSAEPAPAELQPALFELEAWA